MKKPNQGEAPPASIRRSRRLIRRTRPLEAVSAHLAEFEAAATTFENRYNDWLAARTQALVAIGQQHEARGEIEQELRGVGLAILTVDRGRRKSEIYRKYFPKGYGRTLRLSAQESLAIAAGLLVALSDETTPVIVARRESLAAAHEHLTNATAARQAAVEAVGQTRALLEEEKLAWRKALTKFYYALSTVYSDRRRFVEDLFRVDTRRHAAEEEEDEAPVETEPQEGGIARGTAPAAPLATPLTLVTTPAASTAAIDSTTTAATATASVATEPLVPESSVGESAA